MMGEPQNCVMVWSSYMEREVVLGLGFGFSFNYSFARFVPLSSYWLGL